MFLKNKKFKELFLALIFFVVYEKYLLAKMSHRFFKVFKNELEKILKMKQMQKILLALKIKKQCRTSFFHWFKYWQICINITHRFWICNIFFFIHSFLPKTVAAAMKFLLVLLLFNFGIFVMVLINLQVYFFFTIVNVFYFLLFLAYLEL